MAEGGPWNFWRNNMVLQYAAAEAETGVRLMAHSAAEVHHQLHILWHQNDATSHYHITQGAQDWFPAIETMPTISGYKGRKEADCNLTFICIFKLVRLWTVAEQWQRIFIIISLVGWREGGREWLCLLISVLGKTQFSILDHQIWFWFLGPHRPCRPWKLVQNLSWPFRSICPPFVRLALPSPPFPLCNPTNNSLCMLNATTFSFVHFLQGWLQLHSVQIPSMCQHHDVFAKNTWHW